MNHVTIDLDPRVEAALDAYDAARCRAHSTRCPPMSPANRAFIRPMIAAALAAADATAPQEDIDRLALHLCQARGEEPEGSQVKFLDDGMHSISFLVLAKRDVQIVVSALRTGAHLKEQDGTETE